MIFIETLFCSICVIWVALFSSVVICYGHPFFLLIWIHWLGFIFPFSDIVFFLGYLVFAIRWWKEINNNYSKHNYRIFKTSFHNPELQFALTNPVCFLNIVFITLSPMSSHGSERKNNVKKNLFLKFSFFSYFFLNQ